MNPQANWTEADEALRLAQQWEKVRSDDSYGAAGKNLGILARAFLAARSEKTPRAELGISGQTFVYMTDGRVWIHNDGEWYEGKV